jgi:hypothetical protein
MSSIPPADESVYAPLPAACPPKEIIVSASPDHAASDAGPLPTTLDAESAQELWNQMAEVAGAMFSLLLLQAPGTPVQQDTPRTTVAAPAGSPAAVLEAPTASIALPRTPVLLTVPVPVPDVDLAPVPAPPPPSIAMPSSIPMPDPVEEPTAVAESEIPAIASEIPRTMAMLSEIGFLDD